ncbi:copper resistance protein CopC [Psychrobacillus sp.]|uniref:copper resistance CopC family protein n=1 Tax=Psychrobacillus sp. TaxID=1871623 RepID=UPI0028BEFDE4|nr:copper resistance protein CopC [Psychrobacillus sp.]
MKKIIIATLACLFLFGGQALAHTGLDSSNPANGSVVSEALKEISLTFESKIEQTSSFELVNENNEKVHITNLTVSENVMTGAIDKSIENGAYKILWKIIGADGHLINGEIAFTLDAPIVEEVQEEISAPDAESEVLETPKEEVTAVESEEDSNTGMIVIIIAIIVVLAGSVWWMTRRKSK